MQPIGAKLNGFVKRFRRKKVICDSFGRNGDFSEAHISAGGMSLSVWTRISHIHKAREDEV